MGLIIAAMLICMGICFLIIGTLIVRSETKFNNEYIETTGDVCRYYHSGSDNNYYYQPYVKLTINGVERDYRCKATKVNEKTCPIGTTLTIRYRIKEVFGLANHDIRVADEKFKARTNKFFGIIFNTIGLITVIIGVIIIFL